MILRHLHENQRDAIGIGDVHLVQGPRLLTGFSGDLDAARAKLVLGGVQVAHLQPERAGENPVGIGRPAVPGQFEQGLPCEKDCATGILAGDREAQGVPVEARSPWGAAASGWRGSPFSPP